MTGQRLLDCQQLLAATRSVPDLNRSSRAADFSDCFRANGCFGGLNRMVNNTNLQVSELVGDVFQQTSQPPTGHVADFPTHAKVAAQPGHGCQGCPGNLTRLIAGLEPPLAGKEGSRHHGIDSL